MQATEAQRVAARLRALTLQGITGADAVRRAHEIEGLPAPPPAPDDAPASPAAEDIEDLHWRHSCEIRRADAACKRAARATHLLADARREITELRRQITELHRTQDALVQFAAGPPVVP